MTSTKKAEPLEIQKSTFYRNLKRLIKQQEKEQGRRCGVIDALSDLRHICDELGFDFGACDRMAYQHYAAEAYEEVEWTITYADCPHCGWTHDTEGETQPIHCHGCHKAFDQVDAVSGKPIPPDGIEADGVLFCIACAQREGITEYFPVPEDTPVVGSCVVCDRTIKRGISAMVAG